jgi:hypothetical protein
MVDELGFVRAVCSLSSRDLNCLGLSPGSIGESLSLFVRMVQGTRVLLHVR